MLETSIELAPDPAELQIARAFVDTTLTAWGLESICEDARLIASELSANAVLHARTDFQLTLRSEGLGDLRIKVRDGNGRMTSPGPPGQGATSGRGLVLVSALATSWGTQVVSDGKVVWVPRRVVRRAGSVAPAGPSSRFHRSCQRGAEEWQGASSKTHTRCPSRERVLGSWAVDCRGRS